MQNTEYKKKLVEYKREITWLEGSIFILRACLPWQPQLTLHVFIKRKMYVTLKKKKKKASNHHQNALGGKTAYCSEQPNFSVAVSTTWGNC